MHKYGQSNRRLKMALYEINSGVPIIERGIPMPGAEAKRLPGKTKYPFAAMRVGDSFFVPKRQTNAISATAAPYQQNGRKFSCRATKEKGVSGVRVWRVK
jgi:hypothetical protein